MSWESETMDLPASPGSTQDPDYMPNPSGDSDGCYYTGAKGYSTKVVLNIT